MGTVGQFSVIFLARRHNSTEIYCRCSITQNIVKKRGVTATPTPFCRFVKSAGALSHRRPRTTCREFQSCHCSASTWMYLA